MAFYRIDDRDFDLTTLRGRAERGVRRLICWGDRVAGSWTDSHGWAPDKAAAVLERGRLDRLRSLCWCVARWLDPIPDGPAAEGELLLAWVNLGAVVEGSMRFFLTVHADTYARDPLMRWDKKSGTDVQLDPHELDFDRLRQFFAGHVWCTHEHELVALVELVQRARNAIHQVDPKKKDLPTHDELLAAIATAGEMADSLDTGMPDDPPTYHEYDEG